MVERHRVALGGHELVGTCRMPSTTETVDQKCQTEGQREATTSTVKDLRHRMTISMKVQCKDQPQRQ